MVRKKDLENIILLIIFKIRGLDESIWEMSVN